MNRKFRQGIVAFLAAFGLLFGKLQDTAGFTNSALLVFGVFLLLLSYLRTGRVSFRALLRGSVLIPAVLFSLTHLIALNLDENGDFSALWTLNGLLVQLYSLLSMCFFFAVILHLLFTKTERFQSAGGPAPDGRSLAKLFLAVCLLLALAWLPYLLYFYPGNISTDSATMLVHINDLPTGGGDNTNNPFFQTVLFNSVVNLGRAMGSDRLGLVLFLGLQTAATIAVFSAAIVTLAYYSANRTAIVALCAVYALIPVYPIFSDTACKDSNFAVAALALSLSTLWLRNPPRSKRWRIAVGAFFSLSLMLVALLRNGATAISGIVLAGLLFALKGKARRNMALWSIPAIAVVVAFSIFVSSAGESASIRESLSIPFQQTARYVKLHSDELTQADKDAIDRVLHYNKLAKAYNMYDADAVKNTFREDATDRDMKAFWKVWMKLVLRHPMCALAAFFGGNYRYYYPGGSYAQKKLFHLWNNSRLEEFYDFRIRKKANIVDVENTVRGIPIVNLFVVPGLYGAALIVLVALTRRRRYSLLPLLPCILVFIGCLFSPINGYFRYVLPLAYALPFLAVFYFTVGDSFYGVEGEKAFRDRATHLEGQDAGGN